MPDMPEQQSGAAPDQVDDPISAAETVVNDPSKKDTPEYLAAQQLLADKHRSEDTKKAAFGDLEKEMQALKGMSEI